MILSQVLQSFSGGSGISSILLGSLRVGGVGFFVSLLAVLIILCASLCLVFKKMKNQWYEVLIPGHNAFVLITNAGKPGRWFFVPVLGFFLVNIAPMLDPSIFTPYYGGSLPSYAPRGNILLFIGSLLILFVYFNVSIGLAKKFGRTTGFGIGLALLPWIFLPILGYGNAVYKK